MKQEISEKTVQVITPEKKPKPQVLNIDYFYKLYEKEKKKYPPSFFCVNKPTKLIRKKSVPLRLYKKIILQYLKIYFFDFYITTKYIYFPLGGFLKKVLYAKWVGTFQRGITGETNSGSEGAIGLFWYMRASMKMAFMVKIKKLTGSSNRIPKIEAIFEQRLDKDLLPTFTTEIRKAQTNKTLYVCTRK